MMITRILSTVSHSALYFLLVVGSLMASGEIMAETYKAEPKKGDTFDPPLSERVPTDVSALPVFGSIEWKITHVPWVEEGPYAGVSGAGMVEIDNQIYVYGGFIPAGDGSDDISRGTSRWTWRYNPDKQSWDQLPDAPMRREYVRAIAAGDKMFVAGGGCQYKNQDPPYKPHADVAVLNTAADPPAWKSIAPLNLPRTHMAVGFAGGQLVIAGGNQYAWSEKGYSHKTIRGTVETLNPEKPGQGWQVRTPIPGPGRGWTASVARDQHLFVLGGLTWNDQNEAVPTIETLRYDVASDDWEALQPPPIGVSGWEAALYADRYALAVGGVMRVPGSDSVWSDLVLAYDIRDDAWMQVEGKLPPGAVFNDPGVVIIGDTIYVLGAEGPGGSHYDYFLIGMIERESGGE
jgi:hypothetical protein